MSLNESNIHQSKVIIYKAANESLFYLITIVFTSFDFTNECFIALIEVIAISNFQP